MNPLRRAVAVLVALGAAGCAGVADKTPLFDVPKVERIAIDGKADDWGERGFRVDMLAPDDGELKPAENLGPALRLAWDDRGLLVLVTVTDDVPLESPSVGRLWTHDCAELFYADRRGGTEKAQCIVAPGRDPKQPKLRYQLYDQRSDAELKKVDLAATVAGTHTKSGYVLEVLLPWANLGIRPQAGREAAFQAYVVDSDAEGTRHRVLWYPLADTHAYSTRMHRIRLAAKPSPPVVAAAAGRYERLRRARVDVTAVASLAGKPVALREGGRTLARATLAGRAGRAFATLRAPMPPRGKPYGTLTVRLGARPIATLDLPDPDKQRARQIMDAGLLFRSHVFSEAGLPKCELEHPVFVEELIGLYEIDVTYYDAAYNVVTRATKPGRYGAVVKIRAEDGRTFTRYRTLFRMPKRLVWWQWQPKGALELPEEFGIAPQVAAQSVKSINEAVKWALAARTERSADVAVLLAGLAETEPGGGQASVFDSPQARDRQWWVGLKRRLNGNDKRFARPFVCPGPIQGKAAPVLRKGTLKEAGMKPDAAKKIDAVLTEWAADTDQGFIACVARHGVIVLHKAYGRRDGKPMTDKTQSWMASLTKLLHGSCMMMLVDQGLADLDDPVEKYLPAFKGIAAAAPMTVRHLFTHTAGMWGHWGDERNDFEHLVAEYSPHLEIGRKHQYNGMSLSLGSKIIEQISGESLPAFYKKHLLDPLGCEDTDVTNSSYDAESTAMDMARIGQMLLNGGAYGSKRFFSKQALEKMLPAALTKVLGPETKKVWGIGCTWMSTDVFSKRTFGHGSAASATLRVDLANDLVVSMTRNTAGRNFAKYHPRFLKAVADGMLDAKKPVPGK